MLERSQLSSLVAELTALNNFSAEASSSVLTQMRPDMQQPPLRIKVTSTEIAADARRYRVVVSSDSGELHGYFTVVTIDEGRLFESFVRETFVPVPRTAGSGSATYEFDYPPAGVKPKDALRFTLADAPLNAEASPKNIYWFDVGDFVGR
jgi:hypothetical protein